MSGQAGIVDRNHPEPLVMIVHCVDTEGPLDESISATFMRLRELFGVELAPTSENLRRIQSGGPISGDEHVDRRISATFSTEMLDYNRSWADIDSMLEGLFSVEFRASEVDDFGRPWRITWFCMDHVNYLGNPRSKAVGNGVIHGHYQEWLDRHPMLGDEIQWHYHPKSVSGNPLAAATSFGNTSGEILEILARRVIDHQWFPSAFRPGFHAERPDSHLFLEQWIPFDYGNQSYDDEERQPDMLNGRFGDWARAPRTWRGYHPAVHDYQEIGECRRTIFRCLNVGTRLRLLRSAHVEEAFKEAQESGLAILAFADHDFRDIGRDVIEVRVLLEQVRGLYPDVRIMYCGAEEAAQKLQGSHPSDLVIAASLAGRILTVSQVQGKVFGAQPFLAIKTKAGHYLHDNLDRGRAEGTWCYTFDEQTIELEEVEMVGVGASGRGGGCSVALVDPHVRPPVIGPQGSMAG